MTTSQLIIGKLVEGYTLCFLAFALCVGAYRFGEWIGQLITEWEQRKVIHNDDE